MRAEFRAGGIEQCAPEFQRLQRNMLFGDEQFAVEGAFGRTAAERFFRGKPRQIGIVVFLRKMREDEVARARVKTVRIAKIFADGMIREMPGAAEDALLDDPGIRSDFQHVQIVIRFEQQTIRVAQMNFDEFRHIAEVRHERHLRAIGAKREADRVGRIVGNLKRVNIDITNRKMLAGLNGFHTAQALRESFGQGTAQRVHRLFRDVQRRFPQSEHLRQAIAVIDVFVGDQDAVDAVDV